MGFVAIVFPRLFGFAAEEEPGHRMISISCVLSIYIRLLLVQHRSLEESLPA